MENSYARSSGPIPDLAPPGADVGDPVSDPAFDPEAFKEFAQDVFFKVQAAWTTAGHRGHAAVPGKRTAFGV